MSTPDIIKDVSSLKDIMVSTTQFNRGQAGKIFDQVQEDGMKIVIKNNIPVCVILSLSEYESLVKKAQKGEGDL